MAEYDGISQFVKTAERRVRVVEELLQTPTLVPRVESALRKVFPDAYIRTEPGYLGHIHVRVVSPHAVSEQYVRRL